MTAGLPCGNRIGCHLHMQEKHDLKESLHARLNLIGALDALLQERSVSRAAARTGLTQSGMSHALSSLRALLGDALLVRSGNSMQLTPRVAQMAPGVRRGLVEIQHALVREAPFEPEHSQRNLRIATTDAAAAIIIAPLFQRVHRRAPRLRFDIVPLYRGDASALLEAGELDLLITAQLPDRPGLVRAALYQDDFVCVLRKGHPALRRRFDLDAYLELEHVLITTTGLGQSLVEGHLEKLGRPRRIAVRIGYFVAAPLLAVQSDLVVTMPTRVAQAICPGLPVALRPSPLRPKAGPVSMVWHERYQNDPSAQWLRGEVAAIGAQVQRQSRAKVTPGPGQPTDSRRSRP
jgi:DNA-binding transcriptional LysR family regulator